MTRLCAALAVLALAGPAAGQGVPSGQPLVLWQVLWEQREGRGTQAVLRFLAPEIAREGGSVGYEAALQDMDWLCETHAAPIAGLAYARSDSVVVALLDRPVPRGETDPEATRYFETYAVDGDSCEAEPF